MGKVIEMIPPTWDISIDPERHHDYINIRRITGRYLVIVSTNDWNRVYDVLRLARTFLRQLAGSPDGDLITWTGDDYERQRKKKTDDRARELQKGGAAIYRFTRRLQN